MTTDLEKQFFSTFGIEPKSSFRGCKLGAKYYAEICDEPTCKGCDEEIRKTEYPQITDRILLELICIWNNACLYLEDNIAPINYQKVTETVLEYFVDIENYRFAIGKQEIKHQVRTLFEEG